MAPDRVDVAIIGGGVAGLMTAFQLQKHWPACKIALCDPGESLGRGLAYGVAARDNLLNVPAEGMSPNPDLPDLFRQWLEQQRLSEGRFPRRKIFGQFLTEWSQPIFSRITLINQSVLAVDQGYKLQMAESVLEATHIALCCGLPPSRQLPEVDGVYNDPWNPVLYERARQASHITILGSGLTALDVATELLATTQSTIQMFSRHGRLPRPHALMGDPIKPPEDARSLAQLLRWMRTSKKDGLFRERIEGLRPRAAELWRNLSLEDRIRFFKHIRPVWEIARHRAPPQKLNELEEAFRTGRLSLSADHLREVRSEPGRLHVTCKKQRWQTDLFVNCTGPAALSEQISPLMQSLLDRRLARLDAFGLGLECSPGGQLLDADYKPVPGLFCVGGYRRGVDFESTAVRELKVQAKTVAQALHAGAAQS